MPYYNLTKSCQNCGNENLLFTTDLPRSDVMYKYKCSSCGEQNAFDKAAGFEVDSLPDGAVIIKHSDA